MTRAAVRGEREYREAPPRPQRGAPSETRRGCSAVQVSIVGVVRNKLGSRARLNTRGCGRDELVERESVPASPMAKPASVAAGCTVPRDARRFFSVREENGRELQREWSGRLRQAKVAEAANPLTRSRIESP